jgi:alkylhydroperoxidase/carboxymuconolactone decarboxylase family protein YurZ
METTSLPTDLAAFLESYTQLFGSVPPLPASKFEFSSDIDPDALRFVEQLRAHAFNSTIFDTKTTQLMLFGMLLMQGADAARFHAIAAQRAGATWEELHKVTELAATVAALGAMNRGSAMLNDLRNQSNGIKS